MPSRPIDAASATAPSTTAAPAAAPGTRSWQAVLGEVAAPAAESTDAATPMGLQFELRELSPRGHDRWRGPTSATALP
ncbi:MAG: hypothetical protein Q7T71_04435, partial [Herbiconiux sp.]|nr:hypothetical protein [Herbiconiux sp.]